jgi:glucose/arabinose dehydrogenase
VTVRTRLVLAVAGGLGLALLTAYLLSVQATTVAAPLAPDAVSAVEYASGLMSPVDIASTGVAGDERLFVVERTGRIKVVQPNGATGTVLATPFLNITALVDSTTNGEMGLLGLAFSPDYASDKDFYVYYNNLDGNINLARYSVSGNPNVAAITGTIVLTIPHHSAPHLRQPQWGQPGVRTGRLPVSGAGRRWRHAPERATTYDFAGQSVAAGRDRPGHIHDSGQ